MGVFKLCIQFLMWIYLIDPMQACNIVCDPRVFIFDSDDTYQDQGFSINCKVSGIKVVKDEIVWKYQSPDGDQTAVFFGEPSQKVFKFSFNNSNADVTILELNVLLHNITYVTNYTLAVSSNCIQTAYLRVKGSTQLKGEYALNNAIDRSASVCLGIWLNLICLIMMRF